MFAAAAANLPYGKSGGEDPAAAADLLYTLFISNLDAVTFTVEFAAAANQSEFLWTAYAGYRDAQRRQLANVLHGIAGDRALTSLIDETVHLVETRLLGMSMRRPFISDGTGSGPTSKRLC